MVAVFITFRYGEDFSAAKVRQLASVFPELREARNVYVWDDPQAARRFFTPEGRDRVAAFYGVQPIIEYAEVCALVESSHA
jgi:hypothetical protein